MKFGVAGFLRCGLFFSLEERVLIGFERYVKIYEQMSLEILSLEMKEQKNSNTKVII